MMHHFFRKIKGSKKVFIQKIIGFIKLMALIFFIGYVIHFTKDGVVELAKEIVCGAPGSAKGQISEFCKKHCAPKDESSFWCDPTTYSDNIPYDDMIAYVGEGGCSVAALQCDLEHCPADAWTCMAECFPDPHRVVTEEGCRCQGNWAVSGKKCVCPSPFVIKKGECILPPSSQCYYRFEWPETFFACVAPSREVHLYWEGERILFCKGVCYSSLCVANNTTILNDYWYVRGGFKDVIAAERGRLKSYAPAMGGYYAACRTPL